MTWQFIVNQSPANGALHYWQFISTLLLAGWTMPNAGDGRAAYGANQVTSGGTGVNGFDYPRAWVRMQAPGGVRELCIMRGSSGSDYFWIKYSRLARFTTGGSADTMPTAADETNIWGTGTAGTHFFNGGSAGYRCHCGADDAPPYGAYMINPVSGGGLGHGYVFLMDPVTAADTLDPDPVVFYRQTVANVYDVLYYENAGVSGTGGRTLLGASYVGISGCRLGTQSVVALPPISSSNSVGVNPFSGKDDTMPIFWIRPVYVPAPQGWKGIGTVMRYVGTVRSAGSTLSVNTASDYFCFGGVVFPWNGSAPLI
jgi:hypothetical protein